MTCDLCCADTFHPLLSLDTGVALRSDRTLVGHPLVKEECGACGLVRGCLDLEQLALEEEYRHSYDLSQPEHQFFTDQGPIARSAVFCDWLVESLGNEFWASRTSVLEVGAGAGHVLEQFTHRFPAVSFQGIEMSADAAMQAQRLGRAVRARTVEELQGRSYDCIFAIAVIEHVPSPTAFIKELKQLLTPDGYLVLVQPCQDVFSNDLFFVDHLHHFASQHVSCYAPKCGFVERKRMVGHPLMPNYSLHAWQRDGDLSKHSIEPMRTHCRSSAEALLSDMEQLDRALAEHDRLAVFGLNEGYWIARAYSRLQEANIVCGLDDHWDKPEYAELPFPVMRAEEADREAIDAVLLTLAPMYYPQISARLRALGLQPLPVFR